MRKCQPIPSPKSSKLFWAQQPFLDVTVDERVRLLVEEIATADAAYDDPGLVEYVKELVLKAVEIMRRRNLY
jgi:hypothetical protein